MGLKSTHFVTPSGLDAEEHYTTAYELALIAKEALSNDEFAKAAASESARLCYGNPPYNRTLTNHNKLLKMYDDIVGVKTGFTKKSGRCLVSASKKDGKFVIAVTLNDANDWQDHRMLLDLGLSLINSRQLSAQKNEITINTACGNSIDVVLPSATINIPDSVKVDYIVKIPNLLYAPINKGDGIGTIDYISNQNTLCQISVVSPQTIDVKHNKGILLLQLFKVILSEF